MRTLTCSMFVLFLMCVFCTFASAQVAEEFVFVNLDVEYTSACPASPGCALQLQGKPPRLVAFAEVQQADGSWIKLTEMHAELLQRTSKVRIPKSAFSLSRDVVEVAYTAMISPKSAAVVAAVKPAEKKAEAKTVVATTVKPVEKKAEAKAAVVTTMVKPVQKTPEPKATVVIKAAPKTEQPKVAVTKPATKVEPAKITAAKPAPKVEQAKAAAPAEKPSVATVIESVAKNAPKQKSPAPKAEQPKLEVYNDNNTPLEVGEVEILIPNRRDKWFIKLGMDLRLILTKPQEVPDIKKNDRALKAIRKQFPGENTPAELCLAYQNKGLEEGLGLPSRDECDALQAKTTVQVLDFHRMWVFVPASIGLLGGGIIMIVVMLGKKRRSKRGHGKLVIIGRGGYTERTSLGEINLPGGAIPEKPHEYKVQKGLPAPASELAVQGRRVKKHRRALTGDAAMVCARAE